MGGDLLQGTVELMVLKALSLEPMHGWGIGQRLDQMSGEVFKVPHGSLYPAKESSAQMSGTKSVLSDQILSAPEASLVICGIAVAALIAVRFMA